MTVLTFPHVPGRPEFSGLHSAPLDVIGADLAHTGEWPAADFMLRFLPVYDFQRQRAAVLFCTPMYSRAGAIYGHKAFHDLSTEEWTAIDCAILRHAIAFAHRLAASGIIVAVGASVSYATLCDPIGRMTYRDTLRITRAEACTALIITIEDIPDTAGGKRIGEIVSCVRSLAPRVWVHLPGSHVPLRAREPLHAAGVVLSMPARLPMHGMATEARWLARTASLQAALACMDHVDSVAEFDIVRGAGIRFVAGQALRRPPLAANAPLYDVRDTLYGAPDA